MAVPPPTPDATPDSIESSSIEIDVVCALPDEVRSVTLVLPTGTTARAALERAIAAGLDLEGTGLDPADAPLGIFGRRVDDGTVLRALDRLEVYRPLHRDPMERRRQKAADARHDGHPATNGTLRP